MKRPISEYPQPLRRYLEVERPGGYVSFCYPGQAGALKAHLDEIDNKVKQITFLRNGPEKTKAIKALADYVARAKAEHDEVDAQWDHEIENRR